MSSSNTHIYFCHQTGCANMTSELGSTCDACREDWRRCPDCGDMGATVLGSNYCHECYSRRNHPCNAPPAADGWCPECDMYTVVLPNICKRCQQKRDERCTCDEDTERSCAPCDRRIARRLADQAEYDIWCGVDESCDRRLADQDICICHEENARACPPCSRRIADIVNEAICSCDGGDKPCDHWAQYLADKAEYNIWCGVDECDDCGAPVKDGRLTCLCWADEEDLARMDRDLALRRY